MHGDLAAGPTSEEFTPTPLLFVLLLWIILILPAVATPPAPNASAPKPPVASVPAGSYYGTRDNPVSKTSGDAATAGTPSLNPMVQAWRAFEALVIVLAIIVGLLFALKRFGLVKPSGVALGSSRRGKDAAVMQWQRQAEEGGEAAATLSLLSSLTLPGAGGATVHILSVGGQTLLLGATPQGVSVLAEWEAEAAVKTPAETPGEKAKFDDYLREVGIAPEPAPPMRDAVARISETVDRLQALLARSRSRSKEEAR